MVEALKSYPTLRAFLVAFATEMGQMTNVWQGFFDTTSKFSGQTCLLYLISFTLRLCFGIITGETQHEDEWRWRKGFGRPKLQQSFHRIQCWWMFSCLNKIKSGNMCFFYALEVPPSCDVTTWVPFFVLQTIHLVDILVAMAAMG
jgi:hypothetical protein